MINTNRLPFVIIFLMIFVLFFTGCTDDNDEPVDGEIEKEEDDDDDESEDNGKIKQVENIITAINEQPGTLDEPAVLVLEIDLGNMSAGSNWHKILNAVYTAGKYVELDLSSCAMLYPYFYPDSSIQNGKDKILKIILPGAALSIYGTEESDYAFRYFSELKYASGANIKEIGSLAFYGCAKLIEADFPLVEIINQSVFYNCINLETIDFPVVSVLGDYSFYGCKNIKSVTLPKLKIIHIGTFYNCTGLVTADIPNASHIDRLAFNNCSSLIKANYPLVETLGNDAFRNCASLIEVEFPLVVTVNPRTFMDCENLVTVSFSLAEKIGDEAFRNCINLKTAAFLGNPEKKTFPPNHPLDPWRQGKGLFTEDCFVIYDYAFYGCKSLEVLDIRKAWNIYFAGGCLADIGTHLDMYLFDDDGTKSYGHPPIDFFLGGGNDKGPLTLVSLNIYIPQSGTKVEHSHPGPEAGYHGIKVWVSDILKITVKIERLP